MRRFGLLLMCGTLLVCGGARASNDGKADPDILIDALSTYPTLDAAKRACADDKVVWADRFSGYYYDSAEAKYGATNTGSYACKSDARKARYWSTDPRDSMDGHPGRSFPFDPIFVGS